jgi:hypothetical protein
MDGWVCGTWPRLVYEGVPNGLRARLWQICSGSIYRLRSHDSSGLYRSLFEKFKGRQSLATEQIEKDLHRSFDHPFYQYHHLSYAPPHTHDRTHIT